MIDYGGDVDGAVDVLCRGAEFAEAYRVVSAGWARVGLGRVGLGRVGLGRVGLDPELLELRVVETAPGLGVGTEQSDSEGLYREEGELNKLPYTATVAPPAASLRVAEHAHTRHHGTTSPASSRTSSTRRSRRPTRSSQRRSRRWTSSSTRSSAVSPSCATSASLTRVSNRPSSPTCSPRTRSSGHFGPQSCRGAFPQEYQLTPDTFFLVDNEPELENVDVATNATTVATAFTRYTVAPTTAFSQSTRMTG